MYAANPANSLLRTTYTLVASAGLVFNQFDVHPNLSADWLSSKTHFPYTEIAHTVDMCVKCVCLWMYMSNLPS